MIKSDEIAKVSKVKFNVAKLNVAETNIISAFKNKIVSKNR